MKLNKIDHVGILVKNIESSLRLYQERFGLSLRRIEVNLEYGVRIAFLPLGEVLIELVEPLPGSPFEKILREKGEGFSHLAFEVDHLRSALDELQLNRIPLRDSEPKKGGEGAWVAFLDPAAADNVSIELKEKGTL
jgi:methylmalonyl-CoA epimerase